MTAVLFIRADDLLKAHYKTINVKGHMHGGHWQDTHAARVLVSDDHDDEKVSAGQGSFYQKQAHKKLGDTVDGFHSMAHFDKVGIILKHATKMQQDASASAAISGFKSSILTGKAPTPAQYFAMQNASSKTQADVADACVAAIGADKYEQLLMAASAKANQPKGKTSEPQAPQAVETKPQTQATSPASDLPPNIKAKLEDWATDGYVDRLQSAADDTSLEPHIRAYAQQLLVQFKPIQDAISGAAAANNEPAFGPTDSTPLPGNIKAVIDKIASVPSGDVKGAKLLLGEIVMNNSHNPHVAAYANSKLGELAAKEKPATAKPLHTFTGDGLEAYVNVGTGINKGKFGVTLKDTDAGEFVQSSTFYPTEDAAIKSAKAAAGVKDAPSAGDMITMAYVFTPNETKAGLDKLTALAAAHKPNGYSAGFGPEEVLGQAVVPSMFFGPGSTTGAKLEVVSLLDIIPSQDVIDPGQVAGILKTGTDGASDSPPEVIRIGGKLYLQDGHHRVSAMALAGRTHVSVMVADASGLDSSGQPVFGGNAAGPKEGDTKPGADGSNLVFKNGRWHKYVDADEHGELPPALVPVNDAVHEAKLKAEIDADAKSGNYIALQVFADEAVHGYPGVAAHAQAHLDKHKAAVAAFPGGSFYQKEAIKKLKAEHGPGWDAMHPTQQHALAHAKYQALQGAASQAAAVSGWKKHMLAGQVPTPSEVKAFATMASADSAKAGTMLAEVQGKIGGDKLVVLVSQAHAKAVKASGNVTFAPVKPAKVFVTEKPKVAAFGPNNPNVEFKSGAHIVAFDPASGVWMYKDPVDNWVPVVNEPLINHLNAGRDADGVALLPAAKPVTLADNPAYDHLAQSIASHKGHSLPSQKNFNKLAAQDWMAANPGKGAEMYAALADHKLSHLAAMIGPGVKPAAPATPAAVLVNEAKAKFKGNHDVNNFIITFKLHGGPIAQGMSIDEMLDPPDIAAFQKLTPEEKMDVASAISFYGPHKLQLFQSWLGVQNAKAAAPAGPVPVTSLVFTNTTPGHNKFWSVSTHGKVMKTTYGKLGTQGSTTTKEFASVAAAVLAATKLENEKKAKGYKYSYTGVHQYDAAPAVAAPAPAPQVAPAVAGWVFDPKDQAMSGAKTISVMAPNGSQIVVALDDDNGSFQLMNLGTDGTDGDNYTVHGSMTEVVEELKSSLGMDAPPTSVLQQMDPSYGGQTGPKDGDTKPGADGGTLVFKDGRWHKQGIVVPDFSDDATPWGGHYAKAAEQLKAAFESGGAAAVKKLITIHKTGNKAGKFSFNAVYAKFTVGSNDTVPRRVKMFAFITAMLESKAKAGKKAVFTTAAPAAAAKPAAPKAAKPTVSAPTVKVVAGKPPVTVIDAWTQTGPQKGSNPGGKFKDKNGQEWYCKFPADTDVAMNELLAAKFYQMLGVAVPNLKMVEQGGKVGIASKWVDGISKGTSAQLAKAPGAHQAFALDAWLANWDVVGLSNDNMMLGKDGAAVRVDVGGSLVYRAMGGKKGADFGDAVPELETLLDAKTNDKSAAVFGGINPSDKSWGLVQLNKMKPSQIEELCLKAGPGSDADKAALAKKLVARRAFILAKFGVEDQWASVKALDPTKLPVNPKDLPKPIDFANLNGPGKGLSSKAHINAQNTLDSANMIAFAANGNLTALKDYLYEAVDKETGAALGKKPITDHPSSQIKNQWVGLVELLQSISTPALETLKMPSLGAAGSEDEMSEMAGTFNPLDRVETVAAEHRMGFFMSVSQLDDVHELVAGYKWSYLTSASKFVKDAKAKFSGISGAVRAYIKKVQDSGAINHIWSQGKATITADGEGGHYSGGVHGLASKIYADAAEIPEGTTLTRGMSDTTAGKSMTQQMLQATPGLVMQNTDSMCTSYKEGWSWGGDVVLTIRCGKGCKGTPSFASGRFGSEQEITTLPGQRFVVLSVKKSGSSAHVELFMLPPHEGYVAELGKLEALGKAIVVFFKRMM